MCDCVRACVCVCVESVRPSVARSSEGGRLQDRESLGMSEPLSCEEREGRILRCQNTHCQNVVRTLSERCQNAVRTARSLSEQVWELHKPGLLLLLNK